MPDVPFDKLDEMLERWASGIPKALESGLLEGAQELEGEIKRTLFEIFTSGKGQLARSYRSQFVGRTDGGISAGVFSDLSYARIQDEGGTIKPRSVKNLSIPLTPQAKKRWPRDWPEGQLSRSENKLFATKQTKRGKKLQPQYVLKRSVTLRGRGYLSRAWDAAREAVGEIVGEEITADFQPQLGGA